MTIGLSDRRSLPNPYPFQRRRRWWRKFASPRWLVLAAPVLALPVLAVLLFDHAPRLSDIEQTVSALPVAGDAGTSGQRMAPLGNDTQQVPATISASIYANSAVTAAGVLQQRDSNPVDSADPVDYISAIYQALHPASMAREDLLVGPYALLHMPMVPDLSLAMLLEYCSAQPEDATYGTSLGQLPIDPTVLMALTSFLPAEDLGRFCPRL